MCFIMIYNMFIFSEKFEFYSGAFAKDFAKIAHKVSKSKYFVDI